MSSCCVVLASTVDLTGKTHISRSDAAAVHAAVSCRLPLMACCPAGDIAATQYALASGIRDVHAGMRQAAADCELVWIGSGAMEHGGDAMAAQIADDLNASLLFDVLEYRRENSGRVIIRDAGRGSREVLLAQGRLVLVVSDSASRPPYVSRYRRQQSRELAEAVRHSQGTSAVSGTDLQPMAPLVSREDWQISRPRTRMAPGAAGDAAGAAATGGAADRLNSAFGINATAPSDFGSLLAEADPETSARQLLRYLIHHGFVQSAHPATEEFPPPQPAAVPVDQPGAMSSTDRAIDALTAAYPAAHMPGQLSSRILRRPRHTENIALVARETTSFRRAGDVSPLILPRQTTQGLTPPCSGSYSILPDAFMRVRRQPRPLIPMMPLTSITPTLIPTRERSGGIARRPRPCGHAPRPSRGPFPLRGSD